jgi:hypothetical protein
VIGEDLSWSTPYRARASIRADASGIGLLAQLKIADDMRVEMTDAAEFLHQVEGDVRLVCIDGAANGGEVVRNANREYLVPERINRIAHVELSLAQLRCFSLKSFNSPAGKSFSSANMMTRSFFLSGFLVMGRVRVL